MGTLTEEIFSHKVGRRVNAGEIVVAPVDYAMSHDNTTPLAIESLHKLGRPVWDPERDPPALLRPGCRVRFVAREPA